MKSKIKKIVTPIFLSVLCGMICGKLMFSIYEEKGSNILDSNVIYLLEDSAYNDYDSMKASTISSNYIYYEEDGKYKRVVAMTKNKDNIEKIMNVYDSELTVAKYLLSDEDISNRLDEYDMRIENTSDNEEIKKIIIEMINIYKGVEDIKMVKISLHFINFNIELYM